MPLRAEEPMAAATVAPSPTVTPSPTSTPVPVLSAEEKHQAILEFTVLWAQAAEDMKDTAGESTSGDLAGHAEWWVVLALEDYQRTLEELPAPSQIPELAEIRSTAVDDAGLLIAFFEEFHQTLQEGLPMPRPPSVQPPDASNVLIEMSEVFDLSDDDFRAVLAVLESEAQAREAAMAAEDEWDALQYAIDLYMANNALASLPAATYPVALDLSTNDFSSTGILDVSLYTPEMVTTVHYYCWNFVGLIIRQDAAPAECDYHEGDARNNDVQASTAAEDEWADLQRAIDLFVADSGYSTLPISMISEGGNPSTNDFSSGGILNLSPYAPEIATTVHYYCWNAAGQIYLQGTTPATC